MLVLLSTYRSRVDVESMAGLAVQLGALGAEARVWVPADPPPHAAELVAAQLDTVAAAAEKCDAPVETGVMSNGVWQ